MDLEITLSKVLPLFVYPLGLSLALAMLAAVLAALRRARAAALCGVAGAAILWVAATPATATLLVSHLERTHPPRGAHTVPPADAIVVLGGSLGLPLPPRVHVDLSDSADRILYAARLYRAGVAPRIVVSGGNVFPQPGMDAESRYTAALLAEWGVPAAAILIETESRNTYQNAVFTRRLLEKHRIDTVVLVTSGFHMPRALAVFESAGIRTTPAVSDIMVVQHAQPNVLRFLPSASALEATTLALKEYLGLAVYRWRGWVH